MTILNYPLTVTVNRRLARELTAQYTEQQISAGNEVWESPQILPWFTWLSSLWLTRVEQPEENPWLLLSKQQSQVIWEEVVRQSPAGNGLLQVAETTRVAMVAWQLLQGWDLSLQQLGSELSSGASQDANIFYQWAKAYQQRLESENWLDPEQLVVKLIDACEAGQLILPQKLILAGFDNELDQASPQQQRLLSVIKSQGCLIEKRLYSGVPTNAMRLACKDSDEEIRLAARRCRYLLEEYQLHGSNDKEDVHLKIGVIVPDLQQQKARIAAIFEDTLAPATLLAGRESTSLFNISLGDSLSSLALIKTAFLILSAAVGKLPLEDLSRLLRSPFIVAAETEMTPRAILDARIRQIGDESIRLTRLLSEAGVHNLRSEPLPLPTNMDANPWHCPCLASAFSRFMTLSEKYDLRKKHSVVEWITFFDDLLKALGWPGERTRNSTEHQAYEAWRDLREQFVSLERVMGDVDFNRALQQLKKIASEKIFQVETHTVPVQIMGILEASGLQFDHMLLLGMTDEQWPQKASPNPFLPYKLQRLKKMPHASAEREYFFARKITEQLLQSSAEILVSYPLNNADQHFTASPLITHLPEVNKKQIGLSIKVDLYRLINVTQQPEVLIDNQACPLPENQSWTGGVSVFKDQAACPFRAFARHRLRADMLSTAEAGLNPAERGSLVHAALEQLWGRLRSQEKLKRLSNEQLDDCIVQSVQQAIDEFRTAKSVVHAAPFKTLEARRLKKLLKDWLQIELSRAPFTVIAQEQLMTVSLAGLSIKTRVDRIDKLDTGELAVIDYKTGNPAVNDWAGDRPDDPQLPLYAACLEGDTPQAVMFAKLKKGEQNFIGYASERAIHSADDADQTMLGRRVKQPEQSWDELLAGWRLVLEDLATQFIQGNALVDPKDLNKSCQYCDYQSLCRIDELNEMQGSGMGTERSE